MAGVTHGWFMRSGGVSKGLFQSLNGKRGNGDSNENVDENRQRAVVALNLGKKAGLAHITHAFKSEILHADRKGEFAGFDTSITSNPNIVLSQTTADCSPVIISDVSGSVVALVHGSWHTLKAKIMCDAVAEIKKCTSEELIAGIGPTICQNCYEFGSEATSLFEPKYLTSRSDKFLVDLKLMVHDQLRESGVMSVDDLNICTREDSRFFSHRRAGARSGRFLTLASPHH